jgi:hypothetical protein
MMGAGIKMDFKSLVVVAEKTIPRETIVFTPKTRAWCTLPYKGHKNGCPNYGKNDTCPPKTPYRDDVLKKYGVFTLVYAAFDYATYKEIRGRCHPGWTEAQVKNVLYWQNSVKKIIKEYIARRGGYDDLFGAGSGFWGKPSMEAAGIYVFGTLKNNGIPFEVKPVNKVIMVSLLLSRAFARVSRDQWGRTSLDSFMPRGRPLDVDPVLASPPFYTGRFYTGKDREWTFDASPPEDAIDLANDVPAGREMQPVDGIKKKMKMVKLPRDGDRE